jgi:hypothetical protein
MKLALGVLAATAFAQDPVETLDRAQSGAGAHDAVPCLKFEASCGRRVGFCRIGSERHQRPGRPPGQWKVTSIDRNRVFPPSGAAKEVAKSMPRRDRPRLWD